ncbi:MAG: arylsulfatase, partial [Chloroflexi bacterium]|nr:arylsulfatase [Chloroflexota bacterium]
GYSLYMKDNKLHYAYNYVGRKLYHLVSSEPVPKGRHQLRYEFEMTGKPDIAHGKGAPGIGRLYIDDKQVGQIDLPLTIPILISLGGGQVCGADPGDPVTDDYRPPFKFTGTIYQVTIDLRGETIRDREAEIKAAMVRQ